MKFPYHILTLLLMLTGADAFAQKKMPVITWTKGGELPPAAGEARSLGVAGPATGFHGQMMFVAGGANFPDSMPWQGGKKKYHKNIYIFKKKGGILTAVDGHFQLPEAIAYAATCSTPRGVICAGGENEQGISQKVYLLRWAAELNALVIDTLPPLPLALTNASATAHNNIVYIAGGEYPGGVSNKCWFIDIGHPAATWQELPALPRQVAYAAFVAIKTKKELKLVLAGGRKKTPQGISELYDAVFEFSTLNNKWKERAPLPYALSAGTAVAAGSEHIFLFGGDRGNTFSIVESLLAAINHASGEQEKKLLVQQKNRLLATHPGFSNEVISYNINTGKAKIAATIPFQTPVTTTAFWWKQAVVIPSGEIKAGVRTPQILMATIKHSPK